MNVFDLKDYLSKDICPFCGGATDCAKTIWSYFNSTCIKRCQKPLNVSLWFTDKLAFILFRKDGWEIEARIQDRNIDLINLKDSDKVINIKMTHLDSENLRKNWAKVIDCLRVFS